MLIDEPLNGFDLIKELTCFPGSEQLPLVHIETLPMNAAWTLLRVMAIFHRSHSRGFGDCVMGLMARIR